MRVAGTATALLAALLVASCAGERLLRKGSFSMRYFCLLFTVCLFVTIPSGCNRVPPTSSAPATKGQELPSVLKVPPTSSAPATKGQELPSAPSPPPGQAAKESQQPVAPVSIAPNTGGPITYKVNSLKTQNSVKYSSGGIVLNVAPKEGSSILEVNLTVQNDSKQWETYKSSWFQIVNDAGKPIDVKFMGFGTNIYWSGSGSSSDSDGFTFLKFKGDMVSNEWELAPGKSYTAAYFFSIPAQTQGPRFEVVKR